jgi:deoxyribodipyrimidine photo-lyase
MSTDQQEVDRACAALAETLQADSALPKAFRELSADPRITVRRGGAPDPGGRSIVYWMQRSERGRDNSALDVAVELGNQFDLPVVAYFAAISNFPHANERHYRFLNQGLPDIEHDCHERGVGFVMRRAPQEDPLRFLADVGAAMVVGDENPMRAMEHWRRSMAAKLAIPYWTVDADVIVPSKLLEKAQYSGAVIRPRLMRRLAEFVQPFTNPKATKPWHMPRGFAHDSVHEDITRGWTDLDRSVPPVEDWKGGHSEAMRRLHKFVDHKLAAYDDDRKHPEKDGTSRLSPYLHFGHIGPMTIALAVQAATKTHPGLGSARDSFFNELITWRELSINFCRYNPHYDSIACADNWARATIAEHDLDKREHLYTRTQLERAETYDDLWNAAQTQMVRDGWMPNHLRMYWAKKILEWTPNAETAQKYALYLNDRWFLDGRDPNGYTGVAWAVLGKFDRPWPEREIFGKRRYMSNASTGRKFDSKRYIADVQQMPRQPSLFPDS